MRGGRANAVVPSGSASEDDGENGPAHNLLPLPSAPFPPNRGPFRVEEAGLGSGQVWAAVIDVLMSERMMRPADVRDYLVSAELAARLDARTFTIAVGDELSRSRIAQFWTVEIEEALGMVLGGRGWRVEIVEKKEQRTESRGVG